MSVKSVETIAAIGCRGRDIDDPAEVYHEASRYYAHTLGLRSGEPRLDPSLVRSALADTPAVGTIPLPEPAGAEVPLATALKSRRSLRPSGHALALAELSALLHAAYGLTDPENTAHQRRSVPSAGGLYPLDWYFVSTKVESLPAGVYHYEPVAHRLTAVRTGDVSSVVARSVLTPGLASGVTGTFIVTASFERSRRKYGLRAYRFVLMEAGHSMQNLLLMACCLGLHATPVGGYLDGVLDDLLDIDGVDEATLYVAVVG
jgi:SagB-type dehydrogenase family enzyme